MDQLTEISVLPEVTTQSAQANLPALRFLTCGSVDDGKSTLIGRLLYDQQLILDDQLAALDRDSKKHGTVGKDIDFALLVDGLEAEREQGITIDVAYRAFSTPRRSFIVADTPGHEQYTRNMATGASNCDLAILLVDSRKGLLAQTHRHATIVSLLGIRHVVLAVNKIDLVDYDQAVFDKIVADFEAFSAKLNFVTIQPIPLSARFGENITKKSEKTQWYDGPALLDYLETVEVDEDLSGLPFRMPVQAVAPAASRLSRVLRHHRIRHSERGRPGDGRGFRPCVACRAHCHRRRQSRQRGSGGCRDPDAHRRNRCQPW